jgi:hypothetical protein
LKATREKHQIIYKGELIRITSDFSTEILKARKMWDNVFQALSVNICQPRLQYPAKLCFKIDGERKTSQNKPS